MSIHCALDLLNRFNRSFMLKNEQLFRLRGDSAKLTIISTIPHRTVPGQKWDFQTGYRLWSMRPWSSSRNDITAIQNHFGEWLEWNTPVWTRMVKSWNWSWNCKNLSWTLSNTFFEWIIPKIKSLFLQLPRLWAKIFG